MKLLFVTPRFPYPPIQGDRLIPYYRLRTLSQKHQITLLTFYQTPEELKNLDKISPYCQAIYPVHLPKWKSPINMVRGLFFSNLPLQVKYYSSSNFLHQLSVILNENNFDIIHSYMLRVTPYIYELSKPKVIELIDSMQLNLERRLLQEPIYTRWLIQEELRRIKLYESQLDRYCDYMIVVAEKDKALIPSDRVAVIPNGVDTNLFKPLQRNDCQPVIIFSGNMGYGPNIHAATWFVQNCLPLIKKTIPDVSFIIAGANPTKEISNLARNKSITVTGFVDSMPEILNQAMVAIAPMQSGSGIQNKILEAMACELPVVTTTLGVGSIKAQREQEILVADSPEEFTQKTITMLENPELAQKIGQKARAFVVRNHSWEYAASQVENVYENIFKQDALT